MMEIIGSVALVLGSMLTALGGLGLVRFPDVFTRMHAATKAATVGVIGMTAGAAAVAGVAGALLLTLVAALLFLSGPLGISLLARAASRDPQTPKAESTRELGYPLPAHERISVKRTTGASPLLAVWLLVVWVAMFGRVTINVLVAGSLVSGSIAYAARHFAPRWPHALLHPLGVLRFAAFFLRQLVSSTFDVTRLLVTSTARIEPAIIEVPLRVTTRNEVALLMNAASFTPGTVALEVHGDRLYLHMMSGRPPEEVVRQLDEMQGHIRAAFSGAPRSTHSESCNQ